MRGCVSKVLQSAIAVEAGEGFNRKDTRNIDVLEIMKGPENGHIEIRAFPLTKMTKSLAKMKHIYTNVVWLSNRRTVSHHAEEKLCYSSHHRNIVG